MSPVKDIWGIVTDGVIEGDTISVICITWSVALSGFWDVPIDMLRLSDGASFIGWLDGDGFVIFSSQPFIMLAVWYMRAFISGVSRSNR